MKTEIPMARKTLASPADTKAMQNAVANILTRRDNGFRAFVEVIENLGGLDHEDAVAVANFYIAKRLAKFDGMRFTVKHGAYLDRDVLLGAVITAQAE
jgi:hypothetical protein